MHHNHPIQYHTTCRANKISLHKSRNKSEGAFLYLQVDTHPTEWASIFKSHGSPNVNITGVSNLTPSRWTFSTQDASVIHMEWSEVHLQQIWVITVITYATHHSKGLIIPPPVMLCINWGLPHIMTATRGTDTQQIS